MRNISLLFIVPLVIFFGCSENNFVESKWRVLDEQVYNPEINEETVFTDIDELEKLIFAPASFFQTKGGYYSFEQNIKYLTTNQINEETRDIKLEETLKYSSDKAGNFKMKYQNNNNEGWSMVWKENFLYRKQFGGEYTKSVSMGEHIYLKESLFNSIPAIYMLLRNNVRISSFDKKKTKDIETTSVKLLFTDKKNKRDAVVEKKYLQNMQGTEEMRNDQLIQHLNKKDKKNITGEMILNIDKSYSVVEMFIKVEFQMEDIEFNIEGERIISKKIAERIEIPKYNEEYHRRTLDSSINIMKDKKNDKK